MTKQFHDFAKQFFDCAQLTKLTTNKLTMPFSPVPYYLYCHSIELSLKSILIKLMTTKELKKIGHNLKELYKQLPIKIFSSDEENTLFSANEYYCKKNFEYKNLNQNFFAILAEMWNLEDLEKLAKKLLNYYISTNT